MVDACQVVPVFRFSQKRKELILVLYNFSTELPHLPCTGHKDAGKPCKCHRYGKQQNTRTLCRWSFLDKLRHVVYSKNGSMPRDMLIKMGKKKQGYTFILEGSSIVGIRVTVLYLWHRVSRLCIRQVSLDGLNEAG